MKTTKTILVVDDDIDIINVLKTILSNEGYKVETALNKKEGLKKIKTIKPDLAILDVIMTTEFEGFEMAKEIRETEELKSIPVILQTSIYVLETSDNDLISMAHEYRKKMSDKELQVLLIKNTLSGEAGIDYLDANNKRIWVSVNGFLEKPVNSKVLLPLIEKLTV